MSLHIKINTDTDNYVHIDAVSNDYTLCGLETAGDETIGIKKGIRTTDKITCPRCISIVELCRTVKKSDIKIIKNKIWK